MFKLGDTSGLCEAHLDEKHKTIKTVGDIVDKMAMKCCDIPNKMLAPAKVIEVTNGCFSSAQVIEVSDEFSQSSESDASSDAASTSGGCGGGKSPSKSSCKKNGTSSCGGRGNRGSKNNSCKNPRTGEKLTDIFTPATTLDFMESGYDELLEIERAAERKFRREYCVRTPFPECATCPYNRYAIRTQERDLDALFRQMEDAVQTLILGNYSLATNMFRCPALFKSLITADVRPMAAVAVPTALNVLIDLVSVRGALEAMEGIATAARYSDFRRHIMYSADRLFRSGSKIGIPKAFTTEIYNILVIIGCSPRQITRMHACSLSARDTRYGESYSLIGSRGSGKKRIHVPYKSSGRKVASPRNAMLAEQAISAVILPLSRAKDVIDAPVDVKLIQRPTTEKKTYLLVEDGVVEEGTIYYVKKPVSSPTTSDSDEDEMVEITVEPGTKIEDLLIKYDKIFKKEDNGVTLPDPVKTTDVVATVGRTYYYKDPATKRMTPVKTTVGEKITDVKARVKELLNGTEPEDLYSRVTDTSIAESYTEVDEVKPIPGRIYYKVDEETGSFKPITVDDTTSFEDEIVFIKTELPEGTEISARPFEGSDPLVLDNGLVAAEPIFLDASSYMMSVDTRTLVTKTNLYAGDMASIKDLGMSPYEVKMAYILDHERNGSVVPDDVIYSRIPTALESVMDDDM